MAWIPPGRIVALRITMAGALLALFPVLLLFAPRLAWVALAIAIVMLVNKRMSTARTGTRRHVNVDTDASI